MISLFSNKYIIYLHTGTMSPLFNIENPKKHILRAHGLKTLELIFHDKIVTIHEQGLFGHFAEPQGHFLLDPQG